MSAETSAWLNTRTAVGYTLKRGTAWHYRQADQQGAGNHFPGPIPLEHAVALLNSPSLTEGDYASTYLATRDGEPIVETINDPTRKSIVRPRGAFGADDPGAVLGSHRSGYALHPYGEWLLEYSERILGHADGELAIGTCGILKGGAVAWAQFEMPDNVTTASGVALRPFFAATTSCDGSIATGYMTGAQLIVCDNTLAAADRAATADGTRVRIRHTSGSLDRIADVQEALGLIVKVTDQYAAQIDALTLQKVTPAQFDEFTKRWAPAASDSKVAQTKARNRRSQLRFHYEQDSRVEPWRGSKFGVLQAVNTWRHHSRGTKGGDSRFGRNQHDFLKGQAAVADRATLDLLHAVTA